MVTPDVVELYSDGACRGNPGMGGWGAYLRYGQKELRLYGFEAATTNNRMELTAAIKGLEALRRHCRVRVITDSQYLQQGITQWLANWKQRGWKTASKQPVKNADLWLELDALTRRHTIEWQWARGHCGVPGNEEADRLANQAINEYLDQQGPAS